jgi:hypothetical protein
MAPSSPSYEGDEDVFGSLLNITADQLVALGSRIRELVFKVTTEDGLLVESRSGSFNLARILQLDEARMVIHIPATGKLGDLSRPAKEALESHVQTLKYITEHTSVPVPEVFHFDTSANNEIGAPYIAMSCISGKPVARLWFEDSGPTPLEERRQNILKQLAQAMAQLNVYHFDKIGSLAPNDQDDGYHLGPCFSWGQAEDGTIPITSSGPHLDTSSFLRGYWQPANEKSGFSVGANKVLEEMLPLLPNDSSKFALAHADIDSQNVMADEQGNITGIIDWDNAQTMPNFMGCLRYPSWITRDWYPFMYWPESPDGNSPEELQKYRAYYLQEMRRALVPQGGDDYKLTAKSRIFEAIWIAVSNEKNRPMICAKFVEEANKRLDKEEIPDGHGGLDCKALLTLKSIADDLVDDEGWECLRKGLKALMNLEE